MLYLKKLIPFSLQLVFLESSIGWRWWEIWCFEFTLTGDKKPLDSDVDVKATQWACHFFKLPAFGLLVQHEKGVVGICQTLLQFNEKGVLMYMSMS